MDSGQAHSIRAAARRRHRARPGRGRTCCAGGPRWPAHRQVAAERRWFAGKDAIVRDVIDRRHRRAVRRRRPRHRARRRSPRATTSSTRCRCCHCRTSGARGRPEKPGALLTLLDDGALVDAMAVPEGAGVVADRRPAAAHAAGPQVGRRRPPAAARADQARRRSARRARARRRAVELVGDPRRPGDRQADPPAVARREPRRHAAAAPAGGRLRSGARRRRHPRRRRRRRHREQRRRRPRRHRQRGRPVGVEPGPVAREVERLVTEPESTGDEAVLEAVTDLLGKRTARDAPRPGRRRAGVRAGALLAAVPAIDPAEPAAIVARDPARRAPQPRRAPAEADGDGGRAARARRPACWPRSTRCARRSSTRCGSGSTATSTSARRCGPGATSSSSTSRASPVAPSVSARSSARRWPTSPGMLRSFDYAGRVALATSAGRGPHPGDRRRVPGALAGTATDAMQDRFWSTYGTTLREGTTAAGPGAG